MYATIEDVRLILPPTVTVGDQNLGTPSPGRPNTNRDKLTSAQIYKYMTYAQQEIDSRLNPFYACPLRRIKSHEEEPLNNISAGNNVKVKLYDSGQFTEGMTVRLQDNSNHELCTVSAVPNATTIRLSSVVNSYEVTDSLISIVKFPDPIPVITARLTVSYAFDELFTAEQSPDVSQYGVTQRKLANNAIDMILAGGVLLVGQEHTGRRFLRGSLYDGYKSPTADFQFGREDPRG
jgi:hypothetical protein